MNLQEIPPEEEHLTYHCGHLWFECDCLECKCTPEQTVAQGGHCETCGGDL